MRLLLDQNISFRVIKLLDDNFIEVVQVREVGLENANDKLIWDYSRKNNFTIVTFDSDFKEYSALWGHPPKVILIRTDNQTTNSIAEILNSSIKTISEFTMSKDLSCLEIIRYAP